MTNVNRRSFLKGTSVAAALGLGAMAGFGTTACSNPNQTSKEAQAPNSKDTSFKDDGSVIDVAKEK